MGGADSPSPLLAVDRFASIAFAVFVFIEWEFGTRVEDEELAWQLRFAWFLCSVLVVLLIHRQQQQPSVAEEEARVIAPAAAAAPLPLAAAAAPAASAAAAPAPPPPLPTQPAPLLARHESEPIARTSSSFSLRHRFSLSKKKPRAQQQQQQHLSATDSSALNTSMDSANDSSPRRSFSMKRLFSASKRPHSTGSFTTAAMVPAPPQALPIEEIATVLPVAAVAAAPTIDRFGFGPEPTRPGPDFVYVREDNWGYPGYLSPEQTDALEKMKAKTFACQESLSGAFPIDEACLLRFLRARKFDVDKAERMLLTHMQWRDKYLPASLKPHDIAQVLGSGVARFGPYSKQGEPVFIVKVGCFDPSMFESADLFIKYCAFFFERGVDKLVRGGDKAILFFDMAGWSLRKHATPYAMKLTGELINVIQAQNPERLVKCVLFNTPALFNGTWKIICRMIDPIVAKKIMFVSERELDRVLEFVDAEALPVEYGGKRELPYPIEGYAELHAQNAT